MTGKYQVSLCCTGGGGENFNVQSRWYRGGGELLCPVCVLVVQESAHDWQVPGESVSYRRGGRTSMSSLSGTGGRTTMSSPCARRPGVSS